MREIWSGRLSAGMRAIIPGFDERDVYRFRIGAETIDMRLVSKGANGDYTKLVYFGRDVGLRYEAEIIRSGDVVKLNYCFINVTLCPPAPGTITAIYAEDDAHDPTAD